MGEVAHRELKDVDERDDEDTRRQVRAFDFYVRLPNRTWLPPSPNVLWPKLEHPRSRELSLVRVSCQ